MNPHPKSRTRETNPPHVVRPRPAPASPEDTVLGAVGAAAIGAALTLAGVDVPGRTPLTLLFLLLCPAASAGSLLRGLDPAARIIVSGGAGIVIVSLVAEGMLVADAWSPRGGLVAVAAICLVLLGLDYPSRTLRRRTRSRTGRAHHSM